MNYKLLAICMLIGMQSNAADNTYTTTTTSNSTVNSNSTVSSASNNTSNNTSASTVDHKNQPVVGAKAPSISVSNSDVCVSGVSGGVQSNIVGLSFGTTVIDANCERLKLSRELRKGGMKVASIALLCQDPRVFQAMIMSGTPCPAKGKIGPEAAGYWNAYPELRPDFQEYVANKQILIDAGYLNKDGSLNTGVKLDKATSFKPATTNWN
jgi:hypothetical protein